jgi:serine/threonine protein kinase
LDDVYKEIEIMKKLDHPNIIKLYEIIDDPNSEKLYLIMPVADYGESIEWDPSYTPPSFAALGASGSFNGGRPLDTQELMKNEGCFHFHPNHRL